MCDPLNPDVVMHPPSYPIDPVYAEQYDNWVQWRIDHGLPWR